MSELFFFVLAFLIYLLVFWAQSFPVQEQGFYPVFIRGDRDSNSLHLSLDGTCHQILTPLRIPMFIATTKLKFIH